MLSFREKYKIKLQEIDNFNIYELNIYNNIKKFYELNDKISEKQEDLLYNILKREILFTFKTKTVFMYQENFYRTDYHGDYLLDEKPFLSESELSSDKLNEQITNRIAQQYNSSGTTDKYKFLKTVQIPESIKNLKEFMCFYNDYLILLHKIERARKSSTKNKYIKALKSIINEEYCSDIIKEITNYKHWEHK